jgi:hypothetical protein
MVSEFGAPYIYELDPSGTATNTFGTIVGTGTSGNGVPLSSTNGRGIAVVNGTIYYTTSSSNSVYSYTVSPPTNNGSLFTVSGALGGLSSIAFDGTNFWIADGVTNHAYQYSLTGTLLKTITLAHASGGYVGLEYFTTASGQQRLIANRGRYSTTYDVYDLNGNTVTSAFITAAGGQTNGIFYDGTNFWVVNVPNISIDEYSGATGGSTPNSESVDHLADQRSPSPNRGSFSRLHPGRSSRRVDHQPESRLWDSRHSGDHHRQRFRSDAG